MARKAQDTMCNNKREGRHTFVVPASERLFNTYCVRKNAAFLKEKRCVGVATGSTVTSTTGAQ